MPTVKNIEGPYRVFFYSLIVMSRSMFIFKEKS